MQPVISPEEMAVIDAAAPESLDELIDRAGRAVMSHCLKMLGGAQKCSGKNVLVIAGKGNNGADGKRAAELLADRKVNVLVVAPNKVSEKDFKDIDLVVDAAYGTGLKRPYKPKVSFEITASVLAVDIPSGIDGNTGEVNSSALKADRTITFAALKPGQLLFPGSDFVGELRVADIGLDVSSANIWLLDDESVKAAIPNRPINAHKWNSACWVVGGSSGMTGSVSLAAHGAYRAGAGYVRMSVPSSLASSVPPTFPIEAVGYIFKTTNWGDEILKEADRFKALIIGMGLGMNSDAGITLEIQTQLEKVLTQLDKPLVIDGDGLNLLAAIGPEVMKGRKIPAVLTPHDKEFERLNGTKPSADRIKSVRELALKYNSIVLLKGVTSLIADPISQKVLISNTGDERLATAGTGDVLAGIIGAYLAQGVDPVMATAIGAYLHGKAASLKSPFGFMAGDLPDLIPQAVKKIVEKTGKTEKA